MTTDKSVRKYIITTLLVVAGIMGLSVHSAANAVDLQITQEVKKSVACFSFARAQRLPTSTLDVFIKRIGKHNGDAGAVYWLGYSEGSIDAYGFSNSSKFGNSMELARIDAATNLYKMLGCTINVKI